MDTVGLRETAREALNGFLFNSPACPAVVTKHERQETTHTTAARGVDRLCSEYHYRANFIFFLGSLIGVLSINFSQNAVWDARGSFLLNVSVIFGGVQVQGIAQEYVWFCCNVCVSYSQNNVKKVACIFWTHFSVTYAPVVRGCCKLMHSIRIKPDEMKVCDHRPLLNMHFVFALHRCLCAPIDALLGAP